MTFRDKVEKAWNKLSATFDEFYPEQGGTIYQYLRDSQDESIEELDKNLWAWIKSVASINGYLTNHGAKLNNERKKLILILSIDV